MRAGSHLLQYLLLLALESLEMSELLFAGGEHDVIGCGLAGGEKEARGGTCS